MDSDISDVVSEAESSVSDVKSAGEDVAYNDDDEDYVETAEYAQKGTRNRFKSKAKSGTSSASGTARTRKRTQERNVAIADDDVMPSKRRHTTTASIPEDEEDLEGDEEEADGDEEELDDMDEEELGSEIEKDNNEELPEETPEEDGPVTTGLVDDDERENTNDSLKPTRSKMLLELLGDGSSRKTLTEEEVQLRRAENARKRKNLSEKRSEEEKQETINKLLRRRAGKSRSNIPKEDEDVSSDFTVFSKPRRPYSSEGMTRTLRNYEQDLYCTFDN